MILRGITSLLEADYDVIGTVEDGNALLETALRAQPDVIVLDISMPLLNGIDAARAIKKILPAMQLVFLSMHSSAIYLRKAFEAGASGYVLKSGATEELLKALTEVRNGRVYISPAFDPKAIEEIQNPPHRRAGSAAGLTGRQRHILQLIAEGRQNKEIADILSVSVKTIEFHRGRIMARLGAHTVADLTRFAIQEGLIDGTTEN